MNHANIEVSGDSDGSKNCEVATYGMDCMYVTDYGNDMHSVEDENYE